MKKHGNLWELVDQEIEKVKRTYEDISSNINNNIILFGAGPFGESALRYLKKINIDVKYFVDNSPNKIGTSVGEIPVVSINDKLISETDCILITAKHAVLSIQTQLNQQFLNMSFDAWFAIRNFEKYIHLRDNVFKDDRSREVLAGILLAMLSGNEKYCIDVMDPDQYFCLPPFVNTGKEIFIDAGAYVGDTIEKFIWANNGGFKKIYAFEPGLKQFKALSIRKKRLIQEWALNPDSLQIVNAGLSDKTGSATVKIFDDDHLLGTTLKYVTDNVDNNGIKVYSLDDFLESEESSGTFIKSDIEGMEIAFIKGAKNTIKKNKPKMALSTYHEPDDLFELVDFIMKTVPEYNYALRHHSPMLMDTTLYCWI